MISFLINWVIATIAIFFIRRHSAIVLYKDDCGNIRRTFAYSLDSNFISAIRSREQRKRDIASEKILRGLQYGSALKEAIDELNREYQESEKELKLLSGKIA